MDRPVWVWVVFILSLIFFLSGLVGGVVGLKMALTPPEEITARLEQSQSEMRKAMKDMPSQARSEDHMKGFDQFIAMSKKYSEDPLYRALALGSSLLKLLVALGLLVGSIQLFRIKFVGITILKGAYFLDLFLLIVGLVQTLVLYPEMMRPHNPQIPELLVFAMVSVPYVLNLILLGCLYLGDKSAFVEED